MFFVILTKTIEKHKENQKKQSKNQKNIRKTKKVTPEAQLRLSGHSVGNICFLFFSCFPYVFALFTQIIEQHKENQNS